MISHCDALSEMVTPKPLPKSRFGEGYQEVNISRSEEIEALLNKLRAGMAGLGYGPQDRFCVRLALEEAVVNGLRHGNGGDPTKRVWVRYYLDAEALVAEVQDEGSGFDPSAVPDPTLPENLERPGGRGLLLMRHCMTWVRYDGCGNRLTLCKCPTPPPRASR